MTLVVSLRVMDGVIIAADSLATIESQLEFQVAAERDCPHCSEHVELENIFAHAVADVPCPICTKNVRVESLTPPIYRTASSTMSFAQKLFPFLDTYGVAVFGLSAFGQKTVYNHLKGFERSIRDEIAKDETLADTKYKGINAVTEEIRKFLQAEFDKAFGQSVPEDMPPEVFGVQVVGYNSPLDATPKTVELRFGKTPDQIESSGLDFTVSGDTTFVTELLQLCTNQRMRPVFEHLSLQDAIDYAEFLVRTAATVQRFANQIPTIGGEVDIGLITAYSEFRWIRSKKLARVLEPRYVSAHIT